MIYLFFFLTKEPKVVPIIYENGERKCVLCSEFIPDCEICESKSICTKCSNLFLSSNRSSCINDCIFDSGFYFKLFLVLKKN